MTLEELVFKFRHAIESAKESEADGYYFCKFPTGQCGTTSDMLAQYLIDNGYNHITYVNGTFYGNTPFDNQSHTWLEVNGLVIDIAGDQFKYHDQPLKYDIPVYVGPMNTYYRQFEITPGGAHEHLGLEKSWSNYYDLKNWYEAIKRYM